MTIRPSMLIANFILTLLLIVACIWIAARLPSQKNTSGGSSNSNQPAPRIPCTVKAAREYAGQIKQIAVQEHWKEANMAGPVAERAGWLAAKADFLLSKVQDAKNYDDANIRNQLEDGYVMLLRARHQNDQGSEKITEENGSRLRCYRSPVDDTLQTYSLSVPNIYDPSIQWPLIVSMHGHGWYKPFQGHPAPRYGGAFVLSPQGRGATDYKDLGEDDVMAAIANVKREFNIDPDRVYLTGTSMGGTGSYHLGVHYADQFAAIFPIVGNADNEAWTERWGWNRKFPGRNHVLRKFVQECHTSRAFTCNLRNLPAYILAGSADTIVPPAHSRNMVAEMRAQGFNVEYREYPGVGHGGFSGETQNAGLAWICSWKRNPYPHRVTWKADLLKHGKAYWTRFEQLEHPMQFGTIDAEALDDHTVDIKTGNLLAFSILKPSCLFDASQPLDVRIDDEELSIPVDTDPLAEEWHTFRKHPATGKWMNAKDVPHPGLQKHFKVEGPVNEALMSPFVIVVGTTNEAMNTIWQKEAFSFAEAWKLKNAGYPRMLRDVDVTDEIEQKYNMILFGGSEDNAVTARLISSTPIKDLQALLRFADVSDNADSNVSDTAVDIAERPDVGCIMVYPNVQNAPDRLTVIVHANSEEAAYQVWGRFGNWFNWGIFDSKKYFDFAIYDGKSSSPETMLLVGWFGTDWSLNSSVYYFGNPDVRKHSAAQHYPEYDSVPQDAEFLSLVDLKPKKIDQMRGAIGINRTFFGEPLGEGIGMRAPTTIVYQINGEYKWFDAGVQLLNPRESDMCKMRKDGEAVRFTVIGDKKKLGEVKVDWKQPTAIIHADVSGVKELTLEASPAGGPAWLHMGSAWLSPVLSR